MTSYCMLQLQHYIYAQSRCSSNFSSAPQQTHRGSSFQQNMESLTPAYLTVCKIAHSPRTNLRADFFSNKGGGHSRIGGLERHTCSETHRSALAFSPLWRNSASNFVLGGMVSFACYYCNVYGYDDDDDDDVLTAAHFPARGHKTGNKKRLDGRKQTTKIQK